MAVGASQADLAILLIDVTKGILIQTKRHLKICEMMGIKDYIVVINKMDLINYDKKMYDNIKKETEKIFQKHFYKTLNIIPISATLGDNIKINSDNMKWYKDLPLINYLENIEVNKNETTQFIMPVQRVCRPNQFFRGYQGNVISGSINIGDKLTCLPSKETANVAELFKLDKKVKKVGFNEPITLTLDKEIDISRGCVLTNDDNVFVTNNINVTMLWLDEEILKINTAYYLNIGNVDTLCYIRNINYKINIDTDEKEINFNSVSKNEIIECELEILEKITVTEFEYNKNLGSLILINRITNATSGCAIINKVLDNKNLFFQNLTVTNEERKKSLCQNPITIWFTGLSSSGKSTIANELDKILNSNGYHTMLLDGDNIRMGLNKDLTFTENDRIENIRRISEVAKLINDAGLICITSFISPLEINREMAREIIKDKFFLVYINTPLEECEKRDKKGLYNKARNGIIKDFTGISSPFEEPINPDLVLNNNDYKECAKKIYNSIKERIVL
ncbi:MAG: adenylyl-sulfate kinase [Bacilli bacterium]|nr:adenylyl-sulfate kinase [Bacilli bacterium]